MKKERKDFFYEEKKQKTFGLLPARQSHCAHQGIKVFCFFFSKKKNLPSHG
jgi:hypothetical protein